MSLFKYSDPSDLQKMEQEYPVKNVIQCLRDPRSIGARNFSLQNQGNCLGCTANGMTGMLPPAIEPTAAGFGMGGSNFGAMPPAEAAAKANFCEDDQIGESFSDWLAAEVLPTYMERNHKLTTDQYRNGYANAKRLFCGIEREGQAGRAVHPPVEGRINKIILANPKIRAQMGCPATHTGAIYCDSEKTIGTATGPAKMSPAVTPRPEKAVQ